MLAGGDHQSGIDATERDRSWFDEGCRRDGANLCACPGRAVEQCRQNELLWRRMMSQDMFRRCADF